METLRVGLEINRSQLVFVSTGLRGVNMYNVLLKVHKCLCKFMSFDQTFVWLPVRVSLTLYSEKAEAVMLVLESIQGAYSFESFRVVWWLKASMGSLLILYF